MRMPRVIGLLGGSGAGKSTAASVLQQKGVLVIDADRISHELTGPGGKACEAIAQQFGNEYLTQDGAMDRKKMAQLVFSDPVQLEKLEGILHPMMREEIEKRIRAAGKKTVVLDCAVLLKPGFRDLTDEIWLVTAPPDVRLARIQQRDALSTLQAQARIAAQQSEEEMRQACTHVIDNTQDIYELEKQIESALKDARE